MGCWRTLPPQPNVHRPHTIGRCIGGGLFLVAILGAVVDVLPWPPQMPWPGAAPARSPAVTRTAAASHAIAHWLAAVPTHITAAAPASTSRPQPRPHWRSATHGRGPARPSQGSAEVLVPEQGPRPGTRRGRRARRTFSAEVLRAAIDAIQRSEAKGPAIAQQLVSLSQQNAPAPRYMDRDELRACRITAAELCSLVATSAGTFTAADVCTAMDALVRLSSPRTAFARSMPPLGKTTAMFGALEARVAEPEVLATLTARQTARFIWGLAKMGLRREALVELLATHVLQPAVWPRLSGRDLSILCWGLAKVQIRHRPLLRAVAETVSSGDGAAGNLGPQSVANIAWAFAKLGVHDRALMPALALRISQLAEEAEGVEGKALRSQHVANTAWAFATLGVRDEAVMADLSRMAQLPWLLERFNAQEVANTAWAFAKLGVHDRGLMAALSDHARGHGIVARCGVQEVANTAWAYAALRLHDPALMEALAEHILRDRLHERFRPQEIANVAWAYGIIAQGTDYRCAMLWTRGPRIECHVPVRPHRMSCVQ